MSEQTNIMQKKFGLIDYLSIVFKRKKFIFLSTLIASLIVAGISLMLSPVYSATAKVLIPQQDSNLVSAFVGQIQNYAGLPGDLTGSSTKTDLYLEILESTPILDSIIGRFKIMETNNFKLKHHAYMYLSRHVKIKQLKKTDIISITVNDRDPKRAAAMANAFVEELGREATRLNRTTAGENRLFLEDRLAKTKTDLMLSEDELKEFQRKYKVVQVPEQLTVTIKGIAELKVLLAQQEVELSVLRRKFTDNRQEVKNVLQSIRKLRDQIANLESNKSTGAMPSLGLAPQLGEEYSRIIRNLKTNEAVFDALTKQYEMAKVSEVNNVSAIQVVQPASIPEIRSWPARTKMVLVAAFVSFVVSVFLCFVLEAFERLPDVERARWMSLLQAR